MRTYDGGQTWQCISAIRTSSITFKDTLNGIANIPNIAYTNDGGVTWNATAQSIMNLRIPGAAGLYFVNVKTESGVINFKVSKM